MRGFAIIAHVFAPHIWKLCANGKAMNTQDEEYSELQKLGPVIRALCFFLVVLSVFSLLSVITALILEPFHYIGLIAIAVSVLMLHVSGSILFTGFAPKYLLFAHGKVRLDKQ